VTTAEPAPRRVGRYDVERELGRGTMGVVYKARDPLRGRTVALKTTSLAFASSDAERQSFERRFFEEARIAASLAHPGIVIVHDQGRDPLSRLLFIAFEYLDGTTLDTMLTTAGPPPWREGLRIASRVAEALQHAHANGVVHRDLKPANIMLLEGPLGGTVKLMDFGIAKIARAKNALTAAGTLLGTPLFMSPEQAFGEEVDVRSDIFSLGTILYTILTGRYAFTAEKIPDIVAKIVADTPTPPSQLLRGLPAEIDAVVARAMAKSRDARYPSAEALRADLERVLAAPRAAAPSSKSHPPVLQESDLPSLDLLIEHWTE
jgi:eukaryotic-like serine/threonine-protein kinase